MASPTISNVNLNYVDLTGNTGNIPNYLEPSLIRAMVLVPKSFKGIPASDMITSAAFEAYVAGKFVADARKDRWFAFINLDEFKDATKQPSVDDTGLNQQKVIKYNTLMEWRYLTNMGNFIEALNFHNMQNYFNCFFIDLNGTWFGSKDVSGTYQLCPYTIQQLFIGDRTFLTDKKLNMYPISCQLSNRAQIQENFEYFAAGTDPLAIEMLQNVVLTDQSALLGAALAIDPTKDIVITAKVGQGSTDFISEYGSLLTAACFVAYDKTMGAPATIASIATGTIDVAGQTYNYATITLSAAPTAGDVVNVALAAPSVTFPEIATEVVTETQNTVNHTF